MLSVIKDSFYFSFPNFMFISFSCIMAQNGTEVLKTDIFTYAQFYEKPFSISPLCMILNVGILDTIYQFENIHIHSLHLFTVFLLQSINIVNYNN